MQTTTKAEIEDLIKIYHRHLQKLRKKIAILGLNAPTDLEIQVEDLETKLRQLEKQRNAIVNSSLTLGKLSERSQRLARAKAKRKINEVFDRGYPVLDLSGIDLWEFPTEILKLTHVKELELRRTSLKGLPPEIGLFEKLEKLDLYDNYLTTLPPEIGNLRNLKQIDLCKNPLENLPNELGYLKNLERLDLDDDLLPPSLAMHFRKGLKKLLIFLRKRSWSEDSGTMWWLGRGGVSNINTDKLISRLQADVSSSDQTIFLTRIRSTEILPEIGQHLEFRSLFFEGKRMLGLPTGIGQKDNVVLILRRKK